MESPAYRITSIDLLRGLVMIIMALDHARDYFHGDAMLHDPLDLQTTTPILFFTRWITHYCAPVFVFLSGISAFLSGQRKSKAELGNFLIVRGLWLLLIEISIVTFGWTFDPFYHKIVLQVIWAIGVSMVTLGIVCRLPYPWILAMALCIVCGHNLLDTAEAQHQGEFSTAWTLLHHGGFEYFPIAAGHGFLLVYPVLPWIGIMLLGYVSGRLFTVEISPEKRKRYLLLIGSGMIILFIALRLMNAYGDSKHWTAQSNSVYTVLSFLDVSKYPPSLVFTCMTIGPALIFLALAENMHSRLSGIISVFGRVPFFYYILHIYLIHLITVIIFYSSGYGAADIVSGQSFFNFRPAGLGFNLGITYALWLLVVIILYFPSRWYDRYKSTHKKWWLRYI